VPLNNAAFGAMKPSEAQQASGLINLSRQLGGSFGIAVLSTFVTRHIAIHRADLVTNLYAGNPLYDQRYHALVAGMMSHGSSTYEAQQRALTILDGMVMRQSSMLAYNDAWWLILVCFAVVAPAVFLLHKPSARRVMTDAH
jgi:DHA2 family multidrug resistance protein